MARLGGAWQGKAGQGSRRGAAGLGAAWLGKDRGVARLGAARRGRARPGKDAPWKFFPRGIIFFINKRRSL